MMGTVLLTPVMEAFKAWRRVTPSYVPRPITIEEAFEAGYRAGLLANLTPGRPKP